MVSSYLPYPLTDGGNIRLYNLLKNLSSNYEVTLVCEKRNFQTGKDVERVRKLCKKVITIDRRKQWSLKNILRAGFSMDPFLITGHTSSEMKRIIQEELKKDNYDIVHIETFYVMQNLPKITLPIVLVEHNIEYSVYQKFADNSPFFLRPFLNWDIWKMRKKEEASWKRAKILVAVSEKEKKLMETDSIVRNGVDIEKFSSKDGSASGRKVQDREKRVLFIGNFKWLENRDAARWIIKKIWPEIKLKIKNQKSKIILWIVGKKIPDNIKNLTQDSDVIFDENAPRDTSLIYKDSYLLLAPIRMGGGTSFKILEAMASSVPVITTTLGAEGITTGNELIRGDTVGEIVEKAIKLFNDENYYEKTAQAVRELVENKYDWRKITKDLEKVYDKAVKV